MGFYAYHNPEGGVDEARQERAKRQALDRLSRQMDDSMGLIGIKIGIALRNGMDKDLRQQLSEAAKQFGDAFEEMMAMCPERQKTITRR
jgi:hypothetical protein